MDLIKVDRSRGYQSMSLPFGDNNAEIRCAFLRIYDYCRIYDRGTGTKFPSKEEITAIFNELKDDEVIIVLGGNKSTIQNEQLAFVVYTLEGWVDLFSQKAFWPKVVKKVKYISVWTKVKR